MLCLPCPVLGIRMLLEQLAYSLLVVEVAEIGSSHNCSGQLTELQSCHSMYLSSTVLPLLVTGLMLCTEFARPQGWGLSELCWLNWFWPALSFSWPSCQGNFSQWPRCSWSLCFICVQSNTIFILIVDTCKMGYLHLWHSDIVQRTSRLMQ